MSSKKIVVCYFFFEVSFMLMMVPIKKSILNLRLNPQTRDEFAIAAELRGASMSGLLHQFIVRTIREEKDVSPQSFKRPQAHRGGTNIKHSDAVLAPVKHEGKLKADTSTRAKKRKVS